VLRLGPEGKTKIAAAVLRTPEIAGVRKREQIDPDRGVQFQPFERRPPDVAGLPDVIDRRPDDQAFSARCVRCQGEGERPNAGANARARFQIDVQWMQTFPIYLHLVYILH